MKLIDSKELKRRVLDGCFLPDWVRVMINRVIDDMPNVENKPVLRDHCERAAGFFDDDDLTVGEKIHMLRRDVNITQRELADKIGISQKTLSHYEKDRSEPSLFNAVCICDYFHVSLDWLAGRTEYVRKVDDDE